MYLSLLYVYTTSAEISRIITISAVQRVFGDKCNQRSLILSTMEHSATLVFFYFIDSSMSAAVFMMGERQKAGGKLWRSQQAVFSFIIYRLPKRDKAIT
jgi:hypothetical protein